VRKRKEKSKTEATNILKNLITVVAEIDKRQEMISYSNPTFKLRHTL
jgi:hypothetical protein